MKCFVFYLFTILQIAQYAECADDIKYGSLSGVVSVYRNEDKMSPANVVVYVTGFEEAPPDTVYKLEQKDRMFNPTVSAITKGQQVEFYNSDRIKHNVFSMSAAKNFDAGEMSENQSAKIEFKNSGIVDLYCNIHPNMNGSLLILPNRAFASPAKNGDYKIEKIPAGEYTVFAWHSLSAPVKKSIKIIAGQNTNADWSVQLTKDVAKHLKKDGKPYPEEKPFEY